MRSRVLVTLALLAVAAGTASADVWTEQYDVGSEPSLHVTTDDGAVSIRPGPRGKIEVRIETVGYTIGKDVKVRAHQNGSDVEIIVERPPWSWKMSTHAFNSNPRHITVEVTVPSRLNLDVKTGDGAVSAEGLRGQLDLRTGDGQVEVSELTGHITISTGDGAVVGSELDGDVSLRTGDGPVRVAGRFDDLEVHTGDGNVKVTVEDGSRMEDDWAISTGDGPVTLRLPGNIAADLYVHTGDGRIDVDADVALSGSFKPHDMRGSLNGGGPKLSVTTGDGGVRIIQDE